MAAASGLLIATHDLCELHDPGPHHPERPARLMAVKAGLDRVGRNDALKWIEAPPASLTAIERVHPPHLLERLYELSTAGGGAIDADTTVSVSSAAAAVRAAGAGLDLISRLDRGEADVGWSVVRPPGHHATKLQQMGFCLLNNVAVAARFLADRGERVAIVDIDAHHGNGTQDIFYNDPDVLFVSFHQYPCYPGTGAADEVGDGPGRMTTLNIPLPPGATGEIYRRAIDEVVGPVVGSFAPTWLLMSVGFDAHRADPITDLGLTSADYGEIVGDLLSLAPAGRRLLFLEGGYDLEALSESAAAVAAVAVGAEHRSEPTTEGGPGAVAVTVARQIHLEGRLD